MYVYFHDNFDHKKIKVFCFSVKYEKFEDINVVI